MPKAHQDSQVPVPQKASSETLLFRDLGTQPSAAVVKAASCFQSSIRVTADGNTADAKSIMGVMMLAAPSGTVLRFDATGPDAPAAVASLCTLIASDFPALNARGRAVATCDLGPEASALLANTASRFASAIEVSVTNRQGAPYFPRITTDAKSLDGVLRLRAIIGQVLHFTAQGLDSKEAVENLLALFANNQLR